jgi:radical SAM protein with 4Fe4S-binding SPASM domain
VHISDGKVIAPITIEIEQVFRTELVIKTMNAFQRDDRTCFYHKNRCSLKANGDIVPCGYFDDVIAGNVRQGLRRGWESRTMQRVKEIRVSDVDDCGSCALLQLCGTGCRAVAKHTNGSMKAKDPYACFQAPFLSDVVSSLLRKYGFDLRVSNRCREFSDPFTVGEEAL